MWRVSRVLLFPLIPQLELEKSPAQKRQGPRAPVGPDVLGCSWTYSNLSEHIVAELSSGTRGIVGSVPAPGDRAVGTTQCERHGGVHLERRGRASGTSGIWTEARTHTDVLWSSGEERQG